MAADPWSTTEKCHTGQSAYYLVLLRKYSKLHLANSLAGKTKAAFWHATTASQSKLMFTDQQICRHHSGCKRKQTHFQLSEWEHNGLAQKRLQWPVTVCISITHTGHSLEATTGASAAFFFWEQQYKEAELLDIAHRRIIGPERNSIEGTTTRRQEGM